MLTNILLIILPIIFISLRINKKQLDKIINKRRNLSDNAYSNKNNK